MLTPVLNYEMPSLLVELKEIMKKAMLSSGGGDSGGGNNGGNNNSGCSSLSKNDGNPNKDPNYCGYYSGKREPSKCKTWF